MQFRRGIQGVLQNTYAGHRPDTTRYRGNPAGSSRRRFKLDITVQAAPLTGDADIDDNCAFANPFTCLLYTSDAADE